jgi:hypothetical protein
MHRAGDFQHGKTKLEREPLLSSVDFVPSPSLASDLSIRRPLCGERIKEHGEARDFHACYGKNRCVAMAITQVKLLHVWRAVFSGERREAQFKEE